MQVNQSIERRLVNDIKLGKTLRASIYVGFLIIKEMQVPGLMAITARSSTRALSHSILAPKAQHKGCRARSI